VKGTAGAEFIEGKREREEGTVTAGGNVEVTVTAQHNSSHLVRAALLLL